MFIEIFEFLLIHFFEKSFCKILKNESENHS